MGNIVGHCDGVICEKGIEECGIVRDLQLRTLSSYYAVSCLWQSMGHGGGQVTYDFVLAVSLRQCLQLGYDSL